jgi:hypothetical protein
MGEQRHGQAEHEQRVFVLAAQCLPFDIRGVHRQRVVGEGAAVEPGHQQQGQDQREAGDEPQRQVSNQPTMNKIEAKTLLTAAAVKLSLPIAATSR